MTPSAVTWLYRRVRDNPVLGTLAIAAGAFAIAFPINLAVGDISPSRVFLVAVIVSAISYGLWPSLFATLITVLIYDFFFIPPLYSLTIASTDDLINLVLFGVTAVVVCTLTARVRRYAVAADARALSAEKLAAFNRALSDATTQQEVLDTATSQMSALLGRPVALLFAEAETVIVRAHHPDPAVPNDAVRQAVAAWWARHADATTPQRFASGRWAFFPLPLADGTRAAVGIQTLVVRPHFDAQLDDPLLVPIIEQTAMAIERVVVRERMEEARIHAEAGRLRSALLTSISHDLRNPLASIVGSVSSLDRQWRRLEEAEKIALLRTVRGEAERLDAFIANLLDITRIEAGVVRARREPLHVSEVLGAALDQAKHPLAEHRLTIDVPAELPAIEADAALLQQVFYNVIENAAKYSPPDSLIRITARAHHDLVQITVLDEGPGIPEAELEFVFEKFYRARNVVHRGGTGLGLAICRGFLEAMRGTIDIANREDGHGTTVAMALPIASQQALCELETS